MCFDALHLLRLTRHATGPQMLLLIIVLWAVGGGEAQWHYNAGYALAFGW